MTLGVVDSLTIARAADPGAQGGRVTSTGPTTSRSATTASWSRRTTGNARIWRYSLDAAIPAWTHVATANQPTAETSGIVDVSAWFGPGYWFIDVQSHWQAGAVSNWQEEHAPISRHHPYWHKREGGQLLLMKIDGS